MAGKKKEAKSDKELSRTNSLPSSFGRLPPDNGDSSIHPISYHLAKDTSSAPSLNDEIYLKWCTAVAERMFKRDLYRFAVKDEWYGARISLCHKLANMVRTPLTGNGDTALHIAVSANSVDFVQGLVNLVHMTPQDLEIPNSDGNTAFCVSAISGNARLLKIMMGKNGNLPMIYRQDGMLPVHLAASSGHRNIVHLLSSDDLLAKMADNDIKRLFFMTISSDIYDVAIKLFEKYRDLLASARADEKLTALHILARKPSQKFYSLHSAGMRLFHIVWSHVSGLEHNKMLELITKPSTVLFDAIESGNDDTAKWILLVNPEQLTLKDSHGRNLLHCAVLYRQERMLKYILRQRTVNLIIRAVDYDGNNFLHSAAEYQSDEARSRMNTKMQTRLAWFKELEKRVPRDLKTMKNREGKTPKDILYANHKQLSKDDKETVKGIANSGMLVAALIATVAFAAALTVPGDKTSAWFVVFILTNTVALFASSASIISFLSIFTSAWFIDNEFIISQTLINLGLVLLVVSVVSMVLSFAAASFLIFGRIYNWVAYVVVSLGVLPILSFLVLRSKYVDRVLNYFFWSRY